MGGVIGHGQIIVGVPVEIFGDNRTWVSTDSVTGSGRKLAFAVVEQYRDGTGLEVGYGQVFVGIVVKIGRGDAARGDPGVVPDSSRERALSVIDKDGHTVRKVIHHRQVIIVVIVNICRDDRVGTVTGGIIHGRCKGAIAVVMEN